MVAASKLNKRITIQVKTKTRTDTGSVEESWNPLSTVWARTWGATGGERATLAALGPQAKVNRHFVIRHFPYLSTEHRVVYAGKTFNVTFVNHIEEDGETLFDATEIEGQEAV